MKLRHLFETVSVLMTLFCFVLASQAGTATKASVSASPKAVVDAFYKYHFSHDMAFTPETLQNRAAWLTPSLKDACRIYFALPSDPDEVPDIDGDPFTGSQEYPDSYATGSAAVKEDTARVPLTFTWKEDHHSTNGVAVLKNVDGQWLIDDVEFPDQDSIRALLATQTAP